MPEKFPIWRGTQEHIIDLMLTDTKRVTAVCSPTGSGKSVSYVAAALISKQPTCIVTNSRGLQDQLMDDFSGIGMVDIRGRKNYPCEMRPDKDEFSCEDGYASKCPYKGTVACPSSQAEMRAATSSLVVTNYDKWIASRRYGQGMAHFTQVIFDEFHDAPDALARAMQVTLHHREIEQGLKIDFPRINVEEFSTWKDWAGAARPIAAVAMITALARLQGVSDPKLSWVKHYTHMRHLVRRLTLISTARPTDWIVEQVENIGFQFDPIRPARYAESALLLKVPKIIATSATIRPKTCFMVGVGKDNFSFHEFGSDFDPRRCPIYYVPIMGPNGRSLRIDSNTEDFRPLWVRMDQIASKRRDRKGIIHTVSFGRQGDVKNGSRYWENMIFNAKGEAPTEKIEEFREAADGAILTTPSVGTGYDFPGRDCEWQFVCKVPFDPPSRILKAREQEDPEYRGYRAMQKLVQIFGRGMRSKEDQCENFISDGHMEWFKPKYAHLAPKSFHGFYKTLATVPLPPPRLPKSK